MSINRRMNKRIVVYPQKGISFNHRKEWTIDNEIIIVSESGQRKECILYHSMYMKF